MSTLYLFDVDGVIAFVNSKQNERAFERKRVGDYGVV